MFETRRFNLFSVPNLIFLIGFGLILITMLSPRDISLGENFDDISLNSSSTAFAVSRWLSVLILVFCMIRILKVIIRGRLPSAGLSIWLTFVVFFILNVVITAFSGNFQSSDIRLFYVPIVFTAVFVSKSQSNEKLLAVSKVVLLGYIYGSLFAAGLAPGYALLGGYTSFLPGIDFRLFGVAPHANSLGPLAAVYIVIEVMQPSRSKMRFISLIAATAVLLLAQSKTAWVFFLLTVLCYTISRVVYFLFPGNKIKSKLGRSVFYVFGIVVGLGIVVLVLGFSGLGKNSNETEISTLTGRTAIWTITLDEWRNNPLLGYGLNLWDEEFRARNGMLFVGHAHNQFIHTLGSSGLVGLIGLLIYLRALAVASIGAFKRNPVPLILLSLILVECVSEVPLRNTLFDIFFLFHLLLFANLIQDAKDSAKNKKVYAYS